MLRSMPALNDGLRNNSETPYVHRMRTFVVAMQQLLR
jgi:hypothetical protein